MYSCTDGDRVPQISRGRGRLASESMQTLDLMRYAMTSPSHMGLNDYQITGRQELRTSNVVKIGATEILVPGAEFKLLLRLVVALFQTDDGFVPKGNLQGGGLGEEGIYPPHELEQAVSRLRSRLRPGLQDLDAKRYVEVRRGRIRLSTHRKFVIVDRLQLLAHDDE